MISYGPEMKAIAAHFAPLLKEAGFRKRRNSFNRRFEDGITHQFGFFQIGAYSIGHGSFHLHFGVHVPEKSLYDGNPVPKDWVIDADCCIRLSIGPNSPMNYHHAWPITATGEVLSDVLRGIDEGLRTLSRYRSRDAILAATSEPETPNRDLKSMFFFEPPLGILKTCILLRDAQTEAAGREIAGYLKKAESEHADHAAHVAQWARSQGIL